MGMDDVAIIRGVAVAWEVVCVYIRTSLEYYHHHHHHHHHRRRRVLFLGVEKRNKKGNNIRKE